jgi:hypothetical protein
MERTLIAFNLPNIITITLMAAIGYTILGVASQVLQRNSTTAAPSAMGGF